MASSGQVEGKFRVRIRLCIRLGPSRVGVPGDGMAAALAKHGLESLEADACGAGVSPAHLRRGLTTQTVTTWQSQRQARMENEEQGRRATGKGRLHRLISRSSPASGPHPKTTVISPPKRIISACHRQSPEQRHVRSRDLRAAPHASSSCCSSFSASSPPLFSLCIWTSRVMIGSSAEPSCQLFIELRRDSIHSTGNRKRPAKVLSVPGSETSGRQCLCKAATRREERHLLPECEEHKVARAGLEKRPKGIPRQLNELRCTSRGHRALGNLSKKKASAGRRGKTTRGPKRIGTPRASGERHETQGTLHFC